jgi:hypothetical protein
MSHFLLTSTPIYGHVAPMLTVGRGLVSRGHQVTMLTGRKYRGAVESHAMTFQPLPDEVDYDDANLDAWLPGRKQFRGLAAGRYDIIGMFIRPLQSQYYAFTDALASESYDAVVSETAFLGVLPVLLSVPAGHRAPIAGVSATPLSVTSIDCAPFGSGIDPGRSAHTRRRTCCSTPSCGVAPSSPFRMRSTTHWPGSACPAPPTVTSTRSRSLTSPFIWRCRPSNTRDASCPRPCASSDHSGRPIRNSVYRPGGPISNARGRSYT